MAEKMRRVRATETMRFFILSVLESLSASGEMRRAMMAANINGISAPRAY
jgi:hypothetical protein